DSRGTACPGNLFAHVARRTTQLTVVESFNPCPATPRIQGSILTRKPPRRVRLRVTNHGTCQLMLRVFAANQLFERNAGESFRMTCKLDQRLGRDVFHDGEIPALLRHTDRRRLDQYGGWSIRKPVTQATNESGR